MAYWDDLNGVEEKRPQGIGAGMTDSTPSSAYTPMVSPAPTATAPKPTGGMVETGGYTGNSPNPTPVPAAQPANYDGFAAPGYQASTATYNFGKLGGWDEAKFNDAAHQTPKYVLGRILSNYADTPQGLTQAMGDIQRAYPGSQLLDGGKSGKVLIPGVGIVDVGVGFGSGGGNGWAWNVVEDYANRTAPTPTPVPAASAAVPSVFPTANGSAALSNQVYPATRAVDGNPNWQPGQPVPSMPGFVYNVYGGYEPGGAGNPVPGMPGYTYGQDGYSIVTPTGQPVPVGNAPQAAQTPTLGTTAPDVYGFDDAATTNLTSIVDQLIKQRLAPINSPESQVLADQLRQAISQINSGGTAQTQAFLNLIQSQIPGLLGPAFDESQLKQLETQAFDTIDRQRQSEIEATVRTLGMRGIPPSSGIVAEAIKDVDRRYDIAKQQQRQSLNAYEIDQANQRRAQALQLAETGAAVSNTQLMQGVSIAQALDSLGRQLRGEQTTNEDRAVTLASIPVELTQQRISQALQALGLSASQTSGLSSVLSQLASIGASANAANNANNASSWTEIAKLIAQLGQGANG